MVVMIDRMLFRAGVFSIILPEHHRPVSISSAELWCATHDHNECDNARFSIERLWAVHKGDAKW